MLAALMNGACRLRLRLLTLSLLAAAGACGRDDAGPVGLGGPSDPPPGISTSRDSLPTLASVTYTGVPYGPSGLWNTNRPKWPLTPFTGSQNYINADTVILQINAARNKGHRLILAMTGGRSALFTTSGQFDMAKWKKTMDKYKTSTIKTAVANAVADGTVVGNVLIDEPETKQWGTAINKATIDAMASYAKAIFPTLPMGVNHGPPAYKWKSTERYKVVDYAMYQYAHWVTNGNISAWKTAVLNQAKLDGVATALSVNILNGGKQDRTDGIYDCKGPEQAGLGTRFPNCQTTPDQLRTWTKALLPSACFMMMWEFDSTYMAKSANKTVFNELATAAKATPKKNCKRP